MDVSVNERNRSLYDRHARGTVDSEQAAKQRDVAITAPLRKFHNKIKRLLIQRFARLSAGLMDLACGRGGDIYKWIDAEITYVKGFDIAPMECEEARARLENIRKGGQYGDLSWFKADFVATTDIGQKVWKEDKPFDAITCMFALHYFFASKESARKVIELVNANLKEGGYFFGVLPDGKQVMECLGKEMKAVAWKGLKIAPKWKGVPAPFGSAYTIALTDTVTQGHDAEDEGSYEFLVYQKVLVGIAQEFDLHPVVDYDDFELEELLEPASVSSDGTRLFRRFIPNFEADASVRVASALNCSFVFRKGRPLGGEEDVRPEEDKKRKRRSAAAEDEEDVHDLVRRKPDLTADSAKSLFKRSSRFKSR